MTATEKLRQEILSSIEPTPERNWITARPPKREKAYQPDRRGGRRMSDFGRVMKR